MSSLSKLFEGTPCALPEHLQGRLHNDWFGPLKKIPRAWNARGPRCARGGCKCEGKGYLPWPPRLVKGKGVARWESNGAGSILEIPDLRERTVTGGDVYEKKWLCIERERGNPNFGQTGDVTLAHREMSWGEISMGEVAYSPSALQKFSTEGWMRLSPSYWSAWKMLERREDPVEPTGEDKVLFARGKCRPDHKDIYYNVDKVLPIGMVGLHWE